MLLGEGHQLFVSLAAGIASSGHVGIVGPHQFHAAQVHALQFLEVGLPAVIFAQVVVYHLGTQYLAQRGVGGVARVGHQYLLAGVDKGERHMQDAFLRPDERLDLRLRIEGHAIPPLVEVCHRLTQFGRTHGGLVTVGIGIVGHFAEFLDGLLGWGHVGTADSETDDVFALGIELCHFLEFAAEIVFADFLQAVSRLDWIVHGHGY